MNVISMWMPGGWEWIILGFVALLFFGTKRIPGLARSLARTIREFRKERKKLLDGLDDLKPKL